MFATVLHKEAVTAVQEVQQQQQGEGWGQRNHLVELLPGEQVERQHTGRHAKCGEQRAQRWQPAQAGA